ncbi:MAG: NAD-dependent epimerase/dehydratase family protein [Acidimicrobiales bacterium]
MRVLVTGGGGFIGSHLCEALVAEGHQVRVVDRAPAHRVDGVEVQVADLTHPGVAEAAVEGVEAVCHHAAKVGLGVDMADAPGYASDNDLGTAELLAALAASSFTGRLVLASSMVVYGEGRYTCSDHGDVAPRPRERADLEAGRFEPRCPRCGKPLAWGLVGEDARLEPRSLYATSKVAQEHFSACWARETGGSVIALRYHNVYGPRLPLNTPYAGVAAIWRSALRGGRAPQVFEDGGQMRDFVHVRDVARANLAALALASGQSAGAGSFEAFNVCSGRPVNIGRVAELLADAFGPNAPRPEVTGHFRMGDVRHVVASPERAREVLGFSASVPLAEGLAELAAEAAPD